MREGLSPCLKVSENDIIGQGFFLCNFLGFGGGGGERRVLFLLCSVVENIPLNLTNKAVVAPLEYTTCDLGHPFMKRSGHSVPVLYPRGT